MTLNNSFVKTNQINDQISKKDYSKILKLSDFTYDDNSYCLKFESSTEYDFIKKISENINSIENFLNLINAKISFSKFVENQDKESVNEFKKYYKNFLKIKNVYDMNSKNGIEYFNNIIPSITALTCKDSIFLDSNMSKIFIKLMDLFLLVPLTFFENDMNEFVRKKFFYAGDYSNLSDEISYYSTSNFWLDPNNINIAKLIYQISNFCYEFIKNEDHFKFYNINDDHVEVFGYDYFELVNHLNNSNKNGLKKYLYFIFNFLPEDISKEINNSII